MHRICILNAILQFTVLRLLYKEQFVFNPFETNVILKDGSHEPKLLAFILKIYERKNIWKVRNEEFFHKLDDDTPCLRFNNKNLKIHSPKNNLRLFLRAVQK